MAQLPYLTWPIISSNCTESTLRRDLQQVGVQLSVLNLDIPELPLNRSLIASKCNLDRDLVDISLKAIVRKIGETVKKGKRVLLNFHVR